MRALMIAASALTVATGVAAQAAGKSCPAFNKPIKEWVEGPAYVKDGDTVVVAGITVRLKGVDAPEPADTYGREATVGMQAIVGNWLRCGLTGEKTYGREVGYCTNAADLDIGEAIIKKGLALACECFSDRYVRLEQPDALAHLQRAPYCIKDKVAVPSITPSPPPQLPGGCVIKGNINSKGERIYHMPEQRFYNVTIIDPSKGERMFCTEDDAIRAGWRKSKV
jgi:endonuclease YncB( thermonuclease family)